MKPSILVLGSGQDGGSPQLGHTVGIGDDRTASCVAVRSPDGSIVILDASPDIREQGQALMEWDLYPDGRDRLVDAVAITHGHMGHYAGLLQFGKESAAAHDLPLVATPSFLEFIAANEPWRTLVSGGHLRPVPLNGSVTIDSSMSIVGIPVPHRAEFTDTVALSIRIHNRPYLLYVPDIDAWAPWSEAGAIIAEHDIAIVDATFSSREELPGRDMAKIAHPLVTDTIERFTDLTGSTQIVLGHINHSNPVADPTSAIAIQATTAGFAVAKDGMQLF